jgi:LAO/AO transport system kinase
LLSFDRATLSQTITLIESSREDHRIEADQVMKEIFLRTPDRKTAAIRIGICGSPGSGKSTLIE